MREAVKVEKFQYPNSFPPSLAKEKNKVTTSTFDQVMISFTILFMQMWISRQVIFSRICSLFFKQSNRILPNIPTEKRTTCRIERTRSKNENELRDFRYGLKDAFRKEVTVWSCHIETPITWIHNAVRSICIKRTRYDPLILTCLYGRRFFIPSGWLK